ncbi:MAG: mechanosensitive ion channel family protein [Myxococcales bacterium]|jgi:small-conductance mechanosensitive channel
MLDRIPIPTGLEPPLAAAAAAPEGGLLALFNPDAVPAGIAIILGSIVAVRFINRVGDRLAEKAVTRRLLVKNVRTILGFLVYAAAAFFVVTSVFELSSQALFALSGTLAVAAGFALKDLAASFLAGLAILATKPFQVGDMISFGGFYGEVKDIGLRNVQLVTLDESLVTIPTNKFLTEPVASANAGVLDTMVVIPFYLRPDSDHRSARQIVNDAVLASKFLYVGKPVRVLVSLKLCDDARSVIVLTAKAHVFDARHEKAFASDVTDRVLVAFREAGIRLAGRREG